MLPILAGALIGGGATLLSGLIQGWSANNAADTQADAAQAGIDETRRQFDVMQEALQPYTQAGASALSSQQDLAGLNGTEAQKAAISAIEGSSEYGSIVRAGEESILQNASATGGLRGGNTQSSLANFRSDALSSLINQQYSRLGGLTQIGQASAAGVGAGALQTGTSIADLLAQQGAANAGGQVATGQAWNSIPNAITSALGYYQGAGGGSGSSYNPYAYGYGSGGGGSTDELQF